MRPIDADALTERLFPSGNKARLTMNIVMREEIEDAPTIDDAALRAWMEARDDRTEGKEGHA